MNKKMNEKTAVAIADNPLRAAFVQAPEAPATKELLAKASADPDAGVRFIATAASGGL